MKTKNTSYDADRYQFSFKYCTTGQGFAQIDTSQDAWYFGTWANPKRLMIVSYVEGDVTIQFAENVDEFASAVRKIKKWNEDNDHKFYGIDPGLGRDLREQFESIGLGDLLHLSTGQKPDIVMEITRMALLIKQYFKQMI